MIMLQHSNITKLTLIIYTIHTYIQFELPAITTTHSQQGHDIGFYTLKYTAEHTETSRRCQITQDNTFKDLNK